MKRIAVLLLACLCFLSCTADVPEEETDVVIETAGYAYYKVPYPTEETFLPDSGDHTVRMLFVRAGKADCIILEADGLTYLIDTGEDTSAPQVLAALAYMETESIEAVFLTHTDKDHIGGWDAVRQAYPIGTLCTAVQMEAPEIYEKMAEDLPHKLLSSGESYPIGNEGLYLDTLCPVQLYHDEENNNSLVLRLDCGDDTVLFTGDMKEEEEADLLSTGYALDCTVLKVPYHGRKAGSGTAFLEACTPDVSIICSDTETDPDTAHKKVMERLREYGDVYRTEDADLGWLVTIDGGVRTVANVRISRTQDVSLSIADVSREKQTVTIRNDGDTVDLSGCFLYSDRGSELFCFPENTVLEAGESVTVGCAGTGEALIWTGETSVWHKSREDTAILYDRFGNILDRREAE
ncbi:MAG: MBL fold metallo-hydrolase [Clostridia bacterium]|nr:MBL fold metallo-hydrolase [Clostridia bacterium]